MDKLTRTAPDRTPSAPSAVARLRTRVIGSLTTWPDGRQWLWAAGVGVLTLLALAIVGFSTGLYRLHHANLEGLPLRLLVVLAAPAFGEELVFRGLIAPGRNETDRPAAPLLVAVFVFVIWHIVEAETFLSVAARLLERPDFLLCAALLGGGCALLRWRTNSIWPGVALHWLMVILWQTWLGGLILE